MLGFIKNFRSWKENEVAGFVVFSMQLLMGYFWLGKVNVNDCPAERNRKKASVKIRQNPSLRFLSMIEIVISAQLRLNNLAVKTFQQRSYTIFHFVCWSHSPSIKIWGNSDFLGCYLTQTSVVLVKVPLTRVHQVNNLIGMSVCFKRFLDFLNILSLYFLWPLNIYTIAHLSDVHPCFLCFTTY